MATTAESGKLLRGLVGEIVEVPQTLRIEGPGQGRRSTCTRRVKKIIALGSFFGVVLVVGIGSFALEHASTESSGKVGTDVIEEQEMTVAAAPAEVPEAAATPYDCSAGFVNWQAGWSAQKQNWCCSAVGKACPTAPTTAQPGVAAQPRYAVPPGTKVVNGFMLLGGPGTWRWVPAPLAGPPPTTQPPCHTAEDGTDCFSGVVWAKYTGLNLHPDWFPGLGYNSTFEQFQKALFQKGEKGCTMPCDTNTNLVNHLPWGKPSFFCFSVARPGYEMDILKTQIDHGAGIFACEEQAVFSQTQMVVGGWPAVHTILMSKTAIGVSQDGTAANTAIFMEAWHVAKSDGKYLNHDFTIKVDPDALIFPWRLRDKLGSQVGGNIYVRNCNKVPGSPNFPMMFGAVEILSQAAVTNYLANEDKCKTQLPWQSWGEDFFLGKCLQMIGVSPYDDYGMIKDGACSGLWCGDKNAVGFHPLKSVGDWMKCHDEAQ